MSEISVPKHDANALLHGEEPIIQEFLAPLAAGYPGAFGLKDDCATISPTPGHDIVVKTDPVAAGVHFLDGDPPSDIGWKALAVNVSDLAAKGAVPRAYLMALSFPEAPTRTWMNDFARGLGEAQTAFGMHLIGGDTDRRPGPVTVSIAVFGEVPTGTMVRRGTARAGDALFVTGSLGQSALGLRLLREPGLGGSWGLDAVAVGEAVERFRRPKPRLALRDPLRSFASAAMDLSDGLVKDLGRMCRASGCGAIVHADAVPRGKAGDAAVAHDAVHWGDILGSGDDYEVLVAVAPDKAGQFEAVANEAGQKAAMPFSVTRIGEMTAGRHVEMRDGHGQPIALARAGWDHF
ncbi:MAG: thiamine-phosphate kinase [Hyphomicrobiaceae bacterium]